MNLQLLNTELEKPEYVGKSDIEILEALGEPSIPNPQPQAQTPRYLEKMAVLALLSPESAAKVLSYNNLTLVFTAFDFQDHAGACAWVQALSMCGNITPDEAQTCFDYILQELPDATYKPLLSWTDLNVGAVTALDIARARLLPKRATAQAQLEAANQAASKWSSVIAQLDAGIDVEFEVAA